MFSSQNGRINVSGRKARPSTASMTKPSSNHLIPLASSNRVVTGNDITKQLLHIKETDLELAKARFDFHIDLEKKRTVDYQSMLKDNYEEAAKMFQKINNEQLELIKKENENIMQKLLKRHHDEIISLTAKCEQDVRSIAEEKRRLMEMHEEHIRKLKDNFMEDLERERKFNDRKLDDLKQELSAKYEKKLEAQKAKMKQKNLANKEESENQLQLKLDEMFEKMNHEFEERNTELYGTIVEKDDIIASLERKLTHYQNEVDKWKDLYYASQDEIHQKKIPSIEEMPVAIENPLLIQQEELNIQSQTPPPSSPKIKVIEKRDVETMTENYETNETVENNVDNDEELDKYIERTEEKAQALVDTRIETIKFYQKSLIKCLGKLKEYQLLIQRFSNDF